MALFIEIIEGSGKGRKCKVTAGLQIGRAKGDFIVNDPKISGLHAQIEEDAKGNLILADAGSSNGIIINQQKVRQIKIMLGVTFQLGKTHFRIIETELSPIISSMLEKETWRAVLRRCLSAEPAPSQNQQSLVEAFVQPLKLSFIQGIQAEEEWLLGFGPRQAGSSQFDLFLKDSVAPDIAFELRPSPEGVELINRAPEILKINDQSPTVCLLKNDDMIEIGLTKIKVSFISSK